MTRERWKAFGVCALFAGVVWVIYAQTLGFGFVNFDDDRYITANLVVQKGLTLHGLSWAARYGEIGHWHPLTWLSHMLDCEVYGLWPGGHHLTNVLIQMAAAAALFLALRSLTGAFWRSAFVVALWVVHPLRVESVAWISERKDVLSGLFFALTLGAYAAYVRHPGRFRHLLLVIVYGLGLLCKNMLVTLPFLLLLLDVWPLDRWKWVAGAGWKGNWAELKPLIVEKRPLFALAVLSIIMTFLVPEKVAAENYLPFWLRVENAFASCGVYLWQTVWPADLAAYYPNRRPPVVVLVASTVALLAISFVAVRLRKKRPYLLIGWLWFIGLSVPIIGLVQISHYARADRYTYLPQIGLGIGLVWLAAEWTGQKRSRKAAATCLALGLLSTLAVAAHRQASCWRDSVILWTHTLESTEENFHARNNLGNALSEQKKAVEAATEYREALRINPSFAEARNNLGVVLFQQGKTMEAITEYREALRMNPAHPWAHGNLGMALFQQGRIEEAIAEYREALRINPSSAEARCNLGNVWFQQGKLEEAISEYREALRINPAYADAQFNLGNALLHQGKAPEAITEYREVLRINPARADARYNLGKALSQQGRTAEAISEYREALRVDPAYADAHNNLGNALFQQGNTAEAVSAYREALRANPGYAEAHMNLGNVLLQSGQPAEAIQELQKALELQPGNVAFQASLAWQLATITPASLRNGARATALAREANERIGPQEDPLILRVLAAAYAQDGRFPEAVQTAARALQLAREQSNAALADSMMREHDLYSKGSSFPELP